MNNRHKVFVSYHHALDENYKKIFELRFGNAFGAIGPGSVNDGDIEPSLRTDTIRQKIRDTKTNHRSGLLGILLPTYPRTDPSKYNPRTIPPRLYDNIQCGFAAIYNWSENAAMVQRWIHQVYLRKSTKQPDNARGSFGKNRTGDAWTD